MKTLITICLMAFIFVSCKEQGAKTPAVQTPPAEQVAIPDSLFSPITEAPLSVSEAKTKKAGEEVIVSGKILGAQSVFVDNRASFIIGDPTHLTSCDLRKGDNCKSPWDVCCEGTKKIQANTLSIQVLDQDGKILKTSLEGKGGLNKLSELVVKGTISDQSSDKFTIINASSIQVK